MMEKQIKTAKGLIIRVRTITLTLLVVVVLIFYLLVQASFKDAVSWIDFIILTAITIIIHFTYYPDGELRGQQDERYITNCIAYNDKAELINTKRQIFNLTEYCKVDFDNRKKAYVETHCGYLEITPEILKFIRGNYSIKDIKKSEYIYLDEEQTKKYFLSKYKTRTIIKLLFKELPIGYNYPETILSAKETDGSKSIQDGSVKFKWVTNTTKIITALLLGLILAYIGFSTKDSFGLDDGCRLAMYLTSMVATAVFSYSSGEKSMKIFKCNFYIALSNFIERFFEWLLETKNIDINTYTYKQPVEDEKVLKIENKDDIIKT